jgi:hypothetical protein
MGGMGTAEGGRGLGLKPRENLKEKKAGKHVFPYRS